VRIYCHLGWVVLGLSCSDASLKTFNDAPAAQILSHADGDGLIEETTTILFGQVSDTTHDALELSATWYVNGEPVCAGAAPADDGFTQCETTLSTGEARVLLEVTDPGTASGKDTVTLDITPSGPPEVTLSDPNATGTYFADEPIEFVGHAVDAEDTFEQLVVSLSSDRDGTLDVDTTLNAGGEFEAYGYLSEGIHVITLTAVDSAGKSGDTEQVVTVDPANQAPLMAAVEVTPDTGVNVASTLTCTATVTDGDGDTLTVDYSWSRDGLTLGTGNAITLSGTGTTRGDTITCTAIATDPDGESASGTDTVTVENAAAEVSVNLTPAVVYTNDTLTAVVSAADLDDDPVTTTLQWYVNAVAVAETGPTLSGADHFDKHDEVHVVAIANDGTEDGAPATSSTVTVRNTEPTAPVLAFVPEDPITGEEAQCVIDTPSTDEDEDALDYAFSWDVNGAAYTDAGTTDEVGDTLVEGDSETNDIWTCIVVPEDDDSVGESAEIAVTTCPAVLDFDGVDDIVTLPTIDDMPGDFTMEVWVKLDEAPASNTMIMSSECAHLFIAPTEFYVGTFDDCIQTEDCDLGYNNSTWWAETYTTGGDGGFLYEGWDGSWKHIAVTVDSSHNAEMFVDGSSIGTAALNRDWCMSGQLHGAIGGSDTTAWAAGELDGQIANVRMSNAVVYDTTFTPEYPLENLHSTVLLYGLQQDMRTVGLTDESGMAYDGTIVDATWTTGGPDCDE